jgi:hypothetical protein
MSKYIYREFNTRDGEREYTHNAVHRLDDDDDVNEFLENLVVDFWGKGEKDEQGNNWFWGEIITNIGKWDYITKKEYKTLNKFI